MKRKIIFDLDGTLFDTLEDIITAVKDTFSELRLDVPESLDIKKSIGWGSRQLFLSLLADKACMADAALKIFGDIYQSRLTAVTEPYPGVPEILKELHTDFSLNVLTNKPKRFTLPLIEYYSLKELFDSIITPDDTADNIKKPDARLCSMDILKNAVLFVGDSAVDMDMAKTCGIPSVFVTYGYGSLNNSEPSFIIDSISGLRDIIISSGI